jgi:hypothetical protein
MADRSNRPDVRNPMVALPEVQAIALLPREARVALRTALLAISRTSRAKAEALWLKSKPPMAAYWKAKAVDAQHLARAIPTGPDLCGKVCSGYPCTLVKGTGCPDCNVSLHDYPEGS